MVPVTTNQFAIAFPKSPSPATISRMPARRVAIGPWRPTRGQPPRDEIPGPSVEPMSHRVISIRESWGVNSNKMINKWWLNGIDWWLSWLTLVENSGLC